ncbi:uncharacterized protein LOC120779689 isoform X2 [Bactrocera tryoni]|uniref:uncharacterized protein LOC120779689 isoform X2 n=1 Tax=Bactrocera tryoni TaxID=59916 RepID=UPI001A964D79|nr:uncharacterized protein LOC120779689 isoform X2 [Bactrocera tryoni]
MTGKNSGLIAKLKSIIPNISWTHCSLHRQALAAKVKLCKPGYSESFVKIWARFIKISFITQRSGGYPRERLSL